MVASVSPVSPLNPLSGNNDSPTHTPTFYNTQNHDSEVGLWDIFRQYPLHTPCCFANVLHMLNKYHSLFCSVPKNARTHVRAEATYVRKVLEHT